MAHPGDLTVRVLDTARDAAALAAALEVRRRVFVEEQGVAQALERDAYDAAAVHFLAERGGHAVGAARLRRTEGGYKLERVAVLAAQRRAGVGRALVTAMLEAVPEGVSVYLHAQERALAFWSRLGFEAVGERFFEADIAHRKMRLARRDELPS